MGNPAIRLVQLHDFEGLKKYMDAGGDMSGRDENGMTALHYAAHLGRFECVEVILNNKTGKLSIR